MFRISLLFLALGLVLAPAAARAISPATGKPMDEHEAFERVRTARAFAITDRTTGGQLTLQERAFFRVLSGPQPAAKFALLVGKGTLAGRMYGLLGLKVTAPPAFARALPKFLRSWRKVPVAIGRGKPKDMWSRTVAAEIRDRDYAAYLKEK